MILRYIFSSRLSRIGAISISRFQISPLISKRSFRIILHRRLSIDRLLIDNFICSSTKNLQTLTTQDRFRIRDMFDHLQKRQTYPRKSYLIQAPDLALEIENVDLFVDVAYEWYLQSKSIFDRLSADQFNAAIILARLGRINRLTKGRLSQKSREGDRPMIDYFLEKMRGNFDKYRLEEIVGALAGIRDFALFSDSSLRQKSIFVDWLIDFGNRVTLMESTDADYCFLERRSSYVLFLLSSTTSVDRLPSGLLQFLCRLAKIYFDRRLSENASVENRRRTHLNVNDEVACFYYSDVFLYWLYDPDKVVPNSWRSWYDVCALLFETHLKRYRNGESPPSVSSTLRFVSRIVSVTYEFGTSDDFWRHFEIWKRLLSEVLLRTGRGRFDDDSNIDSMRNYLSDFIYNLGLLCKKLKLSDERRLELQSFVPMLDAAMSNLGNYDGLSQVRALTGFRDLKRSLDLLDFMPSTEYLRMLHDWGSDARTRKNVNKASDAAATLFLLRDMKLRRDYVPVRFLETFSLLFHDGLDDVREKDMNRTLSFFGDACLNFDYDPSRFVFVEKRGTDFWLNYFEKAAYYLENVWSNSRSSESESKNKCHLLSILADVAYRYQRIEDFKRLYHLYEKRLGSSFEALTVSQSFYLNRTLTRMMKNDALVVDEHLLRELGRKADLFVPRSQRQGTARQ